MKKISNADWCRMIGMGVLGMALEENQHHFDWTVTLFYIIGLLMIFVGFIMNEDFEF